MSKNEKEEFLSTRELHLASALVTLGFEVDGVDSQIEGPRGMQVGYFKFVISDELKDVEKKYWAGNLLVEPRAFMYNLRSLKARTVGIYRTPGNTNN